MLKVKIQKALVRIAVTTAVEMIVNARCARGVVLLGSAGRAATRNPPSFPSVLSVERWNER
jgi:hypothetical protein